jgi:predicted ATPase
MPLRALLTESRRRIEGRPRCKTGRSASGWACTPGTTLTAEGYVGIDVHKGSRIAAAGHGGQVLLSQATRDLVEADVRDLGAYRLKDLSAPERIFQLGAAEFPPLKTLYRTNLPITSTPFLGRERELAEVAQLLAQAEVRLVTLTGAGGTGKTRLALQAAAALTDRYPDGVWWVPLAQLRDPELVLAEAEQVTGSRKGLKEHVGDRRLLLLLDNFEHVLDAAPALADLLGGCPNMKLLVTSREPLHLSVEREYGVTSLSEQEAVALFRERAPSPGPKEIVRAICLRLDRLPLAIELAAARTKALSAEQVLARLEERLTLLTGGPRDAPERQKTLRATIEWSYELLSTAEQHLFAQLSVFAGGCTLDAAEAVCGAELDTLQSLVEKSLVRYGVERYWMLETIREYAQARLEELSEADELRDRHARVFNQVAAAAVGALVGPRSTEMVKLLEQDHPNIRVALSRAIGSGNRDAALAAIAGIWRFWEIRGHVREGLHWFDQVEDATGSPIEVRLEALRGGAALAAYMGQVSRAERLGEEMLALAQSADDERMTGIALAILGKTALLGGDTDGAISRFNEASVPLRKAGDDVALGHVINHLAYTALATSDYPGAASYSRESLAIAEGIGDGTGRAIALTNLGLVYFLEERDLDASELFLECLVHSHAIGFTEGVAYSYEGLAALASRRGDGKRSARLLGAAEMLRETSGTSLDQVEQKVHDEVVERLGGLLSPTEIAAEWAAGRRMPGDEAIAFASSNPEGARSAQEPHSMAGRRS